VALLLQMVMPQVFLCMKKFVWIFCFFFLWMAISCSRQEVQHTNVMPEEMRDSSFVTVPSSPISITVSSVGDVMMHRWQMNKAHRKETETFDFSKVFSFMQDYFDQTDWLVGNLETTFAGKGKGRDTSILGYSCFPYFNAPDTFAYTIKSAGFDLMTLANNHTFDSGYEGLCSTINLLDSVGLSHVGAYRTKDERQRPFLVDVKGVKLGFCAYTSTTNGIHIPDSLKHVISSIEGYRDDKMQMMKQNVEALKKAGADAVIALVHFGTEYQALPNRYQCKVVDSLLTYGVDVVFGSHPHILQKMEIKEVVRNGSKHKCVVFYSLGNFLSSQVRKDSLLKDVGLLATVQFTKWNGATRISEITCVPTYTFWQPDYIGVLPVLETKKSLEKFSKLRVKDWLNLDLTSFLVENILFSKSVEYKKNESGYRIKLPKCED